MPNLGAKGVLEPGMGHRPAIAQDGAAGRVSSGSYPVGGQLRVGIAEAAVGVLYIEPEEVVVLFSGRGAVVPAQAHAHGQLRSHLPVILSVRREILEEVRLRVAGLGGRAQWTGHKSAYPLSSTPTSCRQRHCRFRTEVQPHPH